MRSIVYARIIQHELEIYGEYEKARENLEGKANVRPKWGLHSINDPIAAKEDVLDSYEEVLTFFEVPEVREEYVRLVDPVWEADSLEIGPGFEKSWNTLLRNAVLNFARVRILRAVPTKLEPILSRLREVLAEINFLYLSLAGFTELIRLLKDRLPGLMGAKLATKLKPTVSPSRQPLSTENMDRLLGTVKYPRVFHTIGTAATNRVRQGLRKQLRGVQIEPVFIQQLESLISNKFKEAFVPRGHKVGMIAAQAVGENASQAGLRSFHHAGITSDTGFDRISNVTNMSSKNPFTQE
jgi:hypothetical protein